MEKGRSSATPLAIGDRLFVGTEFRDRGGADDGGGFLIAIRPGGSGNISPSAASKGDAILWKTADSGIQMASPAYCQGHLYLLERSRGIIVCIDAATGDKVYQKRLPQSRVFWSSPWSTKDRVFCLDDSGTTHVLAGGSEFQVLGRNALEEQTWSSPAVADGALFIRTAQHLYCIADSEEAVAGFE
jgi:outer membrane protein assembly factor BamB